MILVTGATGFVGCNLINFILEQRLNIKIRALVRNLPEKGLWHSEVETVVGSLEDVQNLRTALNGVDTVVHLAARIRDDGDNEAMRNINVEGSKNLYVVAIDSGCKHFIHMSSAAVYGISNADAFSNEEDSTIPDSIYGVTKLDAEKEFLSMDSKGCVLNILRCAGVYGVGTKKELPLLQKIRSQKHVFELSGDHVYNPINIKDVIRSIWAVLEKPAEHKGVFNIGGSEKIRLNDYYALIAKKLGVSRMRHVIPRFLAIPIISLLTKIKPNQVLVKLAHGKAIHAGVATDKFRKFYKFTMTTLDQGVSEYVRWAQEAGVMSK